jgi:adenine-specific DNA-methyltransferase
MLPGAAPDFPEMLIGLRRLVRNKATPAAVMGAVANSLAAKDFPLLPSLPSTSATLAKATAVREFGDWLASMSLTDTGFWLSSAYSQLMRESKRRKTAMFFTPPALGNRMLYDLDAAGLSWAEARIIDIACGGAAFLAPAALRVASAREALGDDAQRVLTHVEKNLVGIEIDPFLARLSQFFVGMHLYRWVKAANRPLTVNITVGDAIEHAQSLAGQFDAVICNPPYRKLTRKEVRQLPPHLLQLCFHQPNLYAMFMASSVRLLNASGVAGLLTPTSYLSGHSFLKLRRFLGERGHVKRIDLLQKRDGVFLGVEQDTAITILGAKAGVSAHTDVFVGTSTNGWHRFGSAVLDTTGGPWVLPRSTEDAKLLAAANGCTLRDYGYSPLVGHLVLYRDKRRRFRALDAARRARAIHPVPLLRALEIRPNRKLVFQRDERPDCYVDVGTSGRGVVRGPAVALQRVSSQDQSRRLNCAPVPRALQLQHDGVIGENHITFLVATQKPKVPTDLLARIMTSRPVDRLFRCRSGVTNVSVYELEHLPLPDPKIVRREVAAGACIDDAVRVGYGIAIDEGKKPDYGFRKKVRRAT